MVTLSRWLKHAFTPPWSWRLSFPADVLRDIEAAIKQSESQHRGELRFAVENALASGRVWHGMSGRQRATEVFANLRVWDTEDNSGVLIYVLLADKEVHILADRGINRLVSQAVWDDVARLITADYQKRHYKEGSLQGIEKITHLLAEHFPAGPDNPNELPNRPLIIRR
jgi:uncharacterized membrane protein